MSLRTSAADLAHRVRQEAAHFADGLRRPRFRAALGAEVRAVSHAVPALVPWLVRARDGARWTMLRAVLRHAHERPDATALVSSEGERLTFGALAERTSRFAHAFASAGICAGDVVALVGPGSADYVALVLAATRVGATAALINTNLRGPQLTHALRVSEALVCVAHARFCEAVRECVTSAGLPMRTLTYAAGDFEALVAAAPATPFPSAPVVASEDFVLIYTSGTTGLPKPSRVSHARALFAGAAFAHLVFGFVAGDVVYVPLPLYHSSGLLLGVGAALVAGVPVIVRETFSAREFWPDVRRHEVTALLYIGELVRYLLDAPTRPDDRAHRVRIAVGNGLRGDVWSAFQARFGVADVREFYAATEAPGGLVNLAGVAGAVGRLPLRRLMPMRLARYDVARDDHTRDGRGFCVECGPNEVGELLVRLGATPFLAALAGFRGYADAEATQKKVLTDVFRTGDRWYRSGDLLRFDDDDFFYFVDRIGDTFRFKGENVSTAEVAEVVERAPGVRGAAVVGVQVPGLDGRAGLAVIATGVGSLSLDLAALARTFEELPAYARPRFLRVVDALTTTTTHKITKASLRADGVDPALVADPLFVLREGAYVALTRDVWREVIEGRLRV